MTQEQLEEKRKAKNRRFTLLLIVDGLLVVYLVYSIIKLFIK